MKIKNVAAMSVAIIVLISVVVGTAGYGAETDSPSIVFPYERIGNIYTPAFNKPSGICWHSLRETLFIVGGEGDVCEIKTDGTLVQQQRIRETDFGDITHDPSTGFLYIAVADLNAIIEIDPETLAVLQEWSIPETFNNKTVLTSGSVGISGITFVPNAQHAQGGIFYLANRTLSLTDTDNISAVLQLELPLKSNTLEPTLVGCICPGVIDLSGLTYDSQSDQIVVISDSTNTVMVYSPEDQLVSGYALPGDDQKGITIDKDGVIYTVEDTGTYSGGIIKRALVSE